LESYLNSDLFDLISPDGKITALKRVGKGHAEAEILVEGISPCFVGFALDKAQLFFNIKSSLAQLGIDGRGADYELDPARGRALIHVTLRAFGKIGHTLLDSLTLGAFIGKLFAADERRRVRDPSYLSRMFGRTDKHGRPLLSLGGLDGSEHLNLQKLDGRAVAFLKLKEGTVTYDESIWGFLSTVAKALQQQIPIRHLLALHQIWNPQTKRIVAEEQLLLVRSQSLHIRTVFGVIVEPLLSPGYAHTSARVLEPDPNARGDIYELYGSSSAEIREIPLEFYTLEPHREHVFFVDRDQLQSALENPQVLFQAFNTAPSPQTALSAAYVVKGTQLLQISAHDWISRPPKRLELPAAEQTARQELTVERYIEAQPQYPLLKAIEDNRITSQGVLLSLYFPSPFMKQLLLSDQVQRYLKAIYFYHPSFTHGSYFSSEDRSLLNDLAKFLLPVYWVDSTTGKILRYAQKHNRDSGMFVPIDKVDHFLQSTVFGLYGSTIKEGLFEEELEELLRGLLALRAHVDHPLLYPGKPLSLVTGGGLGAMAVGNRVARTLRILSCANIVDFSRKGSIVVDEQRQNPYVEAKMTYRLDKLVERQAEFNLDFALFVEGGIGTDFEYALEEVRRKVGTAEATPVLLFGTKEYWQRKLTSRFQLNLESGTIAGSEWLSNCFYCVQTAEQGLKILESYFQGTLPIGKKGPVYPLGFAF